MKNIIQKILPALSCILLAACSWGGAKSNNLQAASTPTIVSALTQTPQPPPPVATTPIPTTHSDNPAFAIAVPGSSPTPGFVPTIDVWNANVISVYWDKTWNANWPEWINNTLVKLAEYPDSLGGADVTVDITQGKDARAVEAPANSGQSIYSPQNTFVIECWGGMRMVRLKDQTLVSETSLWPPHIGGADCSSHVHWSPDESAISFQASDQSVYIWHTDGTAPVKTSENAAFMDAAWSPDSSKLATAGTPTGSRIAVISVMDAAGKKSHEFRIQAGYEGVHLDWLTNEVLAVHFVKYTTRFYDFRTGGLLFTWTSMPFGDGIHHQYPTASPDGRWIFFDQGNQRFESETDPIYMIVQKVYSLYDVQARRQYSLLDYPGEYLSLAGWSADGSTLYLIGLPAESASTSDPSAPFGLLAYNLQTHQYRLLFKDVVQVAWNAEKTWAFVVYPDRDGQGQLGLSGGFWKVGADTLVGKWHLSDRMIYNDPVFDPPPYPGPVSIAWSHSGGSVAVGDLFGRLKILHLDGSESLLANQRLDKRLDLRWSPDDRHLLVEQSGQAWIVDIPTP